MNKIKATKVWLIMWRTFRLLDKLDKKSITDTGLCVSDFAILEILLHKEEINISDITKKILLTSGSSTSAVDRLVEKDFVIRKNDPRDGRGKKISITEKGRDLIEKAFAEHSKNLEVIFKTLADNERRNLIKILLKLKNSNSENL